MITDTPHMKRAADWIAHELTQQGVRDCFMVTGGGSMHLNDAFGQSSLKIWCMHHEQSCSIAAEACARVSGIPAVVNVTTGPGGINALNGVFGAFVDSIPMIIVSGQVKSATMSDKCSSPVRQLGDQEGPTEELAKSCCKATITLQNPLHASAAVAEAFDIATRGRPGPVWIDVPIDIQSSVIDQKNLVQSIPKGLWHFHPTEKGLFPPHGLTGLNDPLSKIISSLNKSKRPLIFMGTGARIAGIHDQVLAWCELHGIGAVGGWGAYDTVPSEHPSHCGRPGTVGDRAGNLAVQNADFLLILGSRLNIRQVSYAWANFAKGAEIFQVDIDEGELTKLTTPLGDKIHANLSVFWPKFLSATSNMPSSASWTEYKDWCKKLALTYPAVEDSRQAERLCDGNGLNPYEFIEALSRHLPHDAIVVAGNGTACVTAMQSGHMKVGQRWIVNSGCASMGYDLPAAFGAWVGTQGRVEIICVAGDGSAMMNIHDLHTWAFHKAKIRCVILDNDGYHSIRQTQLSYFNKTPIGYDSSNGIGFPDFTKVALAFGCFSSTLCQNDPVQASQDFFSLQTPCVAVAKIDKGIPFAPKLMSKKMPDGTMASPSLEDMYPFMPIKETPPSH